MKVQLKRYIKNTIKKRNYEFMMSDGRQIRYNENYLIPVYFKVCESGDKYLYKIIEPGGFSNYILAKEHVEPYYKDLVLDDSIFEWDG